MRHSRSSQRRKVDTFQLSLQREGPVGQFPFLHHRTECGCDYRPRRASQQAGRHVSAPQRGPRDCRDCRHRRSRAGCEQG